MSKLASRKTKLTFETGSVVRSCGRRRPVVIEAEATYAVIWLKGTRTRYTLTWEAVHDLAAKQAAAAVRAEKRAGKRVAR